VRPIKLTETAESDKLERDEERKEVESSPAHELHITR
jgi:hypothetical protein